MTLCHVLRRIAFPLACLFMIYMLFLRDLPAQTFAPTRFTVVDAGTAGKPDVVLIPGLSSSRSVWDAEAKLLAPNYRLHLLQVNGFAGQPAGPNASGPMLTAITDELHTYILRSGMHPAVIGHSLGGLLAMMLAEKYPADVRKLVLVDSLPFYALTMGPDATVETIRPRAEAMRAQMVGMPDDQYAAVQTMSATALVKNPEGQKMVAAASSQSDRTVVINALIEDLVTDVRPGLPGIKAPLLMLYPFEAGTRQGADPGKVDELYASAFKTLPGVKLQRVDGSRHFIMYDQPAVFDSAVESFLR